MNTPAVAANQAMRLAIEHRQEFQLNNAGVFLAHPITAVSYEEWQQVWSDTLGVNLVGAAK